jgi:hypothetical protein
VRHKMLIHRFCLLIHGVPGMRTQIATRHTSCATELPSAMESPSGKMQMLERLRPFGSSSQVCKLLLFCIRQHRDRCPSFNHVSVVCSARHTHDVMQACIQGSQLRLR